MSRRTTRVRIRGPLAPYIEDVLAHLLAQGYTALSARSLLRLMAHLSRWMEGLGVTPAQLTRECVANFLEHRRAAGHTHHISARSTATLLLFLRAEGLAPPGEQPMRPETEIERLLITYERYLQQERGLAQRSVHLYSIAARRFLLHEVCSTSELRQLTAQRVSRFVVGERRVFARRSAKDTVSALRSLLRFLFVSGRIDSPLANYVPAVAGWALAGLPKPIAAEHARSLLRSCDRRTSTGRRDYAVLLLMLRLALRRCEVVRLAIDDVDWDKGEVVVAGKDHRRDRLPLPWDVGDAVAKYLCVRPRAASRALFLRARAPHTAITPTGISDVVYRACDRAGLSRVGAHRLRHSAATNMLREGASLSDVAQVLRHKALQTTTIYAKVDRNRLRTLALPWPDEI